MAEDDVLQQVRTAREAFAAAHDHDVEKMVAFLTARNKAEGRVVVSRPPRSPLYVAVAPLAAVATSQQTVGAGTS